MNKYLIKKYGELNYSIMILARNLGMLINSKETLSKTILAENLMGLNCLMDILGESLDASMEELDAHNHNDLVDQFEELSNQLNLFIKENGFSI